LRGFGGRGWYHSKTTKHEGYETACTSPADEVKVFAGERRSSGFLATRDFFHEVTEDEEGGKASHTSAVEGEDSWTRGSGCFVSGTDGE